MIIRKLLWKIAGKMKDRKSKLTGNRMRSMGATWKQGTMFQNTLLCEELDKEIFKW